MALDDILNALDRHEHMFDLSDDSDLGDHALDIAVGGVKESFGQQQTPEGGPWPALSEGYERAKSRTHPGAPMGVREGLMRSELDGTRVVTDLAAVYTCGQSEPGRDEVDWFSSGGGNRPPRPFVGFTDRSLSESDDLFLHHFETNL